MGCEILFFEKMLQVGNLMKKSRTPSDLICSFSTRSDMERVHNHLLVIFIFLLITRSKITLFRFNVPPPSPSSPVCQQTWLPSLACDWTIALSVTMATTTSTRGTALLEPSPLAPTSVNWIHKSLTKLAKFLEAKRVGVPLFVLVFLFFLNLKKLQWRLIVKYSIEYQGRKLPLYIFLAIDSSL